MMSESSTPGEILTRAATRADIPAIHAIYSEQVLHGTATWEYDPPDLAEMQHRMEAVADGGFPYFVAEFRAEVVGYAYGSSYRQRAGYRFLVEDSIYIREDMRGRGVGKLLLPVLIA